MRQAWLNPSIAGLKNVDVESLIFESYRSKCRSRTSQDRNDFRLNFIRNLSSLRNWHIFERRQVTNDDIERFNGFI